MDGINKYNAHKYNYEFSELLGYFVTAKKSKILTFKFGPYVYSKFSHSLHYFKVFVVFLK